MNAYKDALGIKDELLEHRRYLHQHPEIGMDLEETASYVESQLRVYGYHTKRYGKCGVSAIAGNKKGCILLRADMDALPMQEQSGLSFSSLIQDRAHTCGHDLHTAMLLGAAKLLKQNEESLPCTVKLMFQPAEETGEGALAMLRDGLLQEPRVDCAFAMHVDSSTPCGILASGSGIGTSNSSVFYIHIEGNGCHGSTPYLGVDPMRIAISIYQGIQTIISQEIKPDDIAVASIGSIQAGSTNNIIPHTAVMKGTIRTYDDTIDAYIRQRIMEISEATASAYHGKAHVEFPAFMPSVHNDLQLHQRFISAMRSILPAQQVIETSNRTFGSEDFGFVTREVPSLMIILGARANEPVYGQHHPCVVFNEDCLVLGCAAFVQCAMQLTCSIEA